MKVAEQSRTIIRSGGFDESRSYIKASSQAFDILSKQIYSNPIQAVVREYSTNAWDSHVTAGKKDVPFLIHLPNRLEPFFSIRDYGTGLSLHDVQKIYTTYFESTRTGSDDHAGCYGLGSKSAFAYTDQLTVTSFFGGRKFTFSYYKAEDGCPTLALLSNEGTDEPNGIKIELNVKEGDEHLFCEAASKVYRWFLVKPIGLPKSEYPTPSITGKACEFYQTGDYQQTINVVMGQVCYGIPVNEFEHGLGNHVELILHAPIGSCSITPSREELRLDEKTKLFVQARITQAVTEAVAQIQSDNIGTTAFQTVKNLNSYAQLFTTFKNVGISLYKAEKYSARTASIHENHRNGKSRLYIDQYLYREIQPTNENSSIFVEEDTEINNSIKARFKAWLENQKKAEVILCQIKDHEVFEADFGKCHMKLSELPPLPKKQRDSDGSSERATSDHCHFKRLDPDYGWCDVHGTLDASACVIPRNRTKVIWQGVEYDMDIRLAKIAKFLGYETIYGISRKFYEKKRGSMPDLETEIRKALAAFLAGASEATLSATFGSDNRVYHDLIVQTKNLSTACQNLWDMYNVASQPLYKDMARLCKVDAPPVRDYTKEFEKRYPLISMINYWGKTDQKVIDYIKLVEGIS